jgi:hypothetical protein
MILGFKKQFVEPYKSGRKKHTIREDKPNRWRAGRKIQLATGVRSKNYNQYGEEVCKSVQEVWIFNKENYRAIFVDTKLMFEQNDQHTFHPDFMKHFAINDGFDTVAEFWEFFNKREFFGKIIHWTDLKY